MQDPTTTTRAFHFQAAAAAAGRGIIGYPEQEQLKCPRCDSTNTKFCYYNNYNLSQPRHYCKSCRRYWTKGGSLRNIPVGGGSRTSSSSSSSKRNKRPNPDPIPDHTRRPPQPAAAAASVTSTATTATPVSESGSGRDSVGGGLTFRSLLGSGQLGGVFEPEGLVGNGFKIVHICSGGGLMEDFNIINNNNSGPAPESGVNGGVDNGGGEGGFLQSGEWGNSNGCPDLAIYTPVSPKG